MRYDSESLISAFKGAYRYLSNFYVEEDGFTVEHRFQAAKATTAIARNWILNAPTPHVAKDRGRSVTLRKDWEQVKENVMLGLLRDKFAEGSKLAEWLMSTHPAQLQEGNHWGDTYWGVSLTTGKGQNRLGELLMQVRSELIEQRKDEEYARLASEDEGDDW